MKTVTLKGPPVVILTVRDGAQHDVRHTPDVSAAAEASAPRPGYHVDMFSRHRLAEVASLLGDPTRAGMLLALWDGRALPAGELARLTQVSASTASGHLTQLVAGGLLSVAPHGRERRYRLGGPAVAQALESLAHVLPATPAHAPSAATPALRHARMCYDHLAGRLGVAVADALLARRVLAWRGDALQVTPPGRRWLARFAIELDALAESRRALLRPCLDWTERREHLGGALGAAFASQVLERDWLRRERDSRALRITSAGRAGLRRVLGIPSEALEAAD
jgi:DNA-binding transcriptional ArsR family regulator